MLSVGKLNPAIRRYQKFQTNIATYVWINYKFPGPANAICSVVIFTMIYIAGAGCIKKWLNLTIIKCKRHPIRSAYLRVNHYLINYKIVIKKVIKSFIQPAPGQELINKWIFAHI
jgi:hypothetical protein